MYLNSNSCIAGFFGCFQNPARNTFGKAIFVYSPSHAAVVIYGVGGRGFFLLFFSRSIIFLDTYFQRMKEISRYLVRHLLSGCRAFASC
jgi:hypothetical protein